MGDALLSIDGKYMENTLYSFAFDLNPFIFAEYARRDVNNTIMSKK
jgi:hypothetical protein